MVLVTIAAPTTKNWLCSIVNGGRCNSRSAVRWSHLQSPVHWHRFYSQSKTLKLRTSADDDRRIIRSPVLDRLLSPELEAASLTSSSTDPFLNLSIEQYLLERCAAESKVLFQYINRPCVVIGRNQNPWVETNVRRMKEGYENVVESKGRDGNPTTQPVLSSAEALRREDDWIQESLERDDSDVSETEKVPKQFLGHEHIGSVDLVRRRSGGGTVFHDGGNVNWSVIVPGAVFDRDTHAQMVTDALHRLGIKNARVNERHDIVLDLQPSNPGGSSSSPKTVKVSGSAYRLTRGRALHHATCLVESPNLSNLSSFLRPLSSLLSIPPPVKTDSNLCTEDTKSRKAVVGIDTKGVASVRSPVSNISSRIHNDGGFSLDGKCRVNVDVGSFIRAVDQEFWTRYGFLHGYNGDINQGDEGLVVRGVLGAEMLNIPDIAKGYAELKAIEWKFLQTPHFTLTVPFTQTLTPDITPVSESAGIATTDDDYMTLITSMFEMESRQGVITQINITASDCSTVSTPSSYSPIISALQNSLVGKQIHRINDWKKVLVEAVKMDILVPGCDADTRLWDKEISNLAQQLSEIFPPVRVVE